MGIIQPFLPYMPCLGLIQNMVYLSSFIVFLLQPLEGEIYYWALMTYSAVLEQYQKCYYYMKDVPCVVSMDNTIQSIKNKVR